MTCIPSPYNFVPLAREIFFPDWAERVSMDLPFSDGISGTLQIKVTAKTPLYIRNGGSHPENQNDRLNDASYKDFFRVTPDGPYAIPGTSLKGMLRAVVEIASFGKIAGTRGKTTRVDNHRYAVRDLQNQELYTGKITEKVGNNTYRPMVRPAWLSLSEGNVWELHFCDMARVEQTALEATFTNAGRLGKTRQSAKEKYQLIPPETKILFDCGPEKDHVHPNHPKKLKLRYKKAENIANGQIEGTLVMTGQPAPRTDPSSLKSSSKHMEFIFFDRSNDSFPVPDEVKKDFIFAHTELGENRKPNAEWEFWKEKLDEGKEVPVFVLMEEGKISYMGLALMFRLPYRHSIHETIAHTSTDHLDGSRLDLAELIFGRVEETEGLRGRVSVATLIAEGDPKTGAECHTVLSGPKPTYYPNYVAQTVTQDGTIQRPYKTYMDDDAEIRGWKRYITRKDGIVPSPDAPPSKNVATRFRPLPAGTTFTGTIHLHNLRPCELGALLWAITWGGETRLRHSLGMGKPYGFGSVVLSVTSSDLRWCDPGRPDRPDEKTCQKAFTKTMETFRGGKWEQGEILQSLKAMADPERPWPQEIRYPLLGRGRDGNEFVAHKNASAALVPPFSLPHRGPKEQGGNPPAPGRPRPPPPPPAPQKPAKALSPEEAFLERMGTLSMNDLIKKLGRMNPETIDPKIRKEIVCKIPKGYKIHHKFQPTLKRWEG